MTRLCFFFNIEKPTFVIYFTFDIVISSQPFCLLALCPPLHFCQVENSALNGAIATIIYSDPQEIAPEGTDAAHVYPNARSACTP